MQSVCTVKHYFFICITVKTKIYKKHFPDFIVHNALDIFGFLKLGNIVDSAWFDDMMNRF